MDRKALESRAANYPYLQGEWPMSTGFVWIAIGASNLVSRSWAPIAVAGFLLLALGGQRLITRHYRETYGDVIPTRARKRRYTLASTAWLVVALIGVFVSVDRFCLFASLFAAATLVFYAVLTGVRAHHWVVWGPIFVAGLLPIWAGLGEHPTLIVMVALGVVLIMTGLLDQRLLRREFGSVPMGDLDEVTDVDPQTAEKSK